MKLDWKAVFSSTFKRAFHVLTVTLLSLLLPLSFLLLSRLSYANLSSNLIPSPSRRTPRIPLPLSLFFHPESPNPVHLAVSLITVSALLHGLTGWTPFLAERPAKTAIASAGARPSGMYLAWALLCALQVSVGLGVEGSIASGIGGSLGFDAGVSLASRAVFFLGLHGTMSHWCHAVVRPVVDDTVYGVAAGAAGVRRWPEKAAVAAAYGGMWWWRLRDEVEAIVIVPTVKKEMFIGVGMIDFLGWWLYYLTVTVGMVRVVKGFFWAASLLVCRRGRHKFDASHGEPDMVVTADTV